MSVGTQESVPYEKAVELMQQRIGKEKMDKMEEEESKEVYRMRKSTVEPVIGNVKQNLSFREFSLRGLDKAKIELNLVSIAHNLGKIWRLTRASEC